MTTINLSLSITAFVVGTLAFAPAAGAAVIFNETFEAYTLGNVHAQGDWEDFGGAATADVTNVIANGGTQSLAFQNLAAPGNGYGSDATLDLAAPITSGQLQLTFDIFQPAAFTGKAFLYFSRGPTNNPGSVFQQGVQFIGDGTAGTFLEHESGTTTLLTEQWVPVAINIDLDANTAVAKYGATTVYSGPWVVDAGLPSQYQGIDIWADGGTGTSAGTFYIDNLRLESIPEPGTCAVLGLALGTLALRRRRA